MFSKNVKRIFRSQNSDVKSSDMSNCNHRPLSPIEALLGTDDSILETISSEISANNMSKLETPYEHFGDSEFSQGMINDLKRSFGYEDSGEGENGQIDSDHLDDEEYHWHDETLFNQAIIGASLGSSFSESKSPNLPKRSGSSVESLTPNSPQNHNIPQRQSSFTSDEILFDNFSLHLEEQDEFTILQKNTQSTGKSNFVENVNKKIQNPCNPGGSFYGLPERVKTLIYETKKITSLYGMYFFVIKLSRASSFS